MTKWSGGFPPANWHHHPQQGGGHVSHSHENAGPGHVHSGGALPGGTYEHPALGPQVDELPPLPDEVIYKVAAILHQHCEEESGSKRWPLDAMNTGHAAVTWLSTVGIGSIRERRFAREWRPCNGGWDEVGRR